METSLLELDKKKFAFREDNFHCQKCNDVQWVMGNNGLYRCTCLKNKIKASVLGRNFSDCSFNNFIGQTKKQTEAANKIKQKLNGSYFLGGNVRTGKTHLLSCQYADLLDSGHTELVYTTEYQLYTDLLKAISDKEFIPIITASKIAESQGLHLFIDDIGKLKCSDYFCQEMFGIIDNIYKNNFKLSISSNYPLNSLKGYYPASGDAIIRRIEDICEIIEL